MWFRSANTISMLRMVRSRNPQRVPLRRPQVVLLSIGLALIGWTLSAGNALESHSGPNVLDPLALQNTQVIQDDACTAPDNPTVAENCLAGSESWQIENYSFEILGYPSAPSYQAGDIAEFRVHTQARSYGVEIYRLGFYQGAGARLVAAADGIAGQVQPPCYEDRATGLRSCSNWSPSIQLPIPADWISGVYLVKFVLPNGGGESQTLFVVREDERDSDLLVQVNFSTFHAYNNYGGRSLYRFNSDTCPLVQGRRASLRVSLDRPFIQTLEDPNYYFRAEYPMLVWLESQGYDVTYISSLDTHHSGSEGRPNELLDHRAFLSVGHDEYWSQEMREAMEAALDAGVHLGFFSANTGYWRVRFEPDPWSGAPDRVMVGYKTTESGIEDPSGHPTGTFRDPQGANLPEQALLGVQYSGDNDSAYFPLRVSAEMTSDPIFRNTGLQALPAGMYADIGAELVGWEWDRQFEGEPVPDGLVILAESPVAGALLIDAGSRYALGADVGQTTRYRTPRGAIVFASGTIQWSWGLALLEPNVVIQQMTYNLLAEMGAQPATPSSELVLDGETHAAPELPGGLVRVGRSVAMEPLEIEAPIIEVSGGEARLQWRTNRPSRSQVWETSALGDGYGALQVSGAGGSVAEPFRLEHEARIEGVIPGETYMLQFLAWDEERNVAVSEVVSMESDPPSFRDRLQSDIRGLIDSLVCRLRPVGRQLRYWAQLARREIPLP